MTVRTIAIALAAAASFAAAAPAHAIEYPWCAQYGSGFHADGGRNCGFVSYGQCLATVSGIGGFCERNSFYKGREPAKRRRHVESR